jgi:hypothetical protein
MFKFVRALAVMPVLAAALASASLPAAAGNLPNYGAGGVSPNGAISFGTGFTVQHTGLGTYVVTYPTSTGFTSFPAVTVTPWGVDGHSVTAIVSSIGGSNGGVSFTVQLTDRLPKLKLEDNAFMFTLMES